MKPRTIKDQYGDIVTVEDDGERGVFVRTAQTHGRPQTTAMVFTNEQSRKLRKALKAAEQAT